MATKLNTIATTVNTKLVTDDNIFINKGKMDTYVADIKTNEAKLKTAFKNLSTKTNKVVKKEYCYGDHKKKLAKFATTASKLSDEAAKQSKTIQTEVETGVSNYVKQLITSANSMEELKTALLMMF